MPRKTRKELVPVDEDQMQDQRIAACRRLEQTLHRSWLTAAHAEPRFAPPTASIAAHRLAVRQG